MMCRASQLAHRLWLLGLVCLTATVQAENTHRYTLQLDAETQILSVNAHLTRSGSLIVASRGHWRDLKSVETCDGVPLARVTRRSFRAPGRCFRYRVRLQPVESRLPLTGFAGAWVHSPARFMWLPDDDQAVDVQLDADGLHASLPWQKRGPYEWRIYPAARSGTSIAIFGGQPLALGLDQPGVLLARRAVDRVKLASWLTRYITALGQLLNGHYSSEIQVVVVAVDSRRGSPVPFGHVVREQGSSVRFYVNADADLTTLVDDWTAPHELAHLLLPYVRARWISEGFASYYQNVLLARTGVVTPQQAWDKLQERFARAAAEGRRVTPASAASRLLTYWSGAALALRADIALRQKGSSLDEVLSRLAQCCLPGRQSWSAVSLASKLDELAGSSLFLPLVRTYGDQSGMPPTADLFAESNSAIRQQIMAATEPH